MAFAGWWYAVTGVLVAATWIAVHRGAVVRYEGVAKLLLAGVAAGLVLYLAPNGFGSIQKPVDFELRFLAALGIAWLVAMRAARDPVTPGDCSALALAGFVGVNVPPLALVASATMVCGGSPTCL